MKRFGIRILPLIYIISFQTSCDSLERKSWNIEQEHLDLETLSIGKDSEVYYSTCDNKKYKVTLHETELDSDPLLTIKYDKEIAKEDSIKLTGLENEMIRINWCTNNYIVLESPCGGPCSTNRFIFLDQQREVENYQYCQQIKNSDNLIIYRKNEEFELVRIRNLTNGKELIRKIDYCDDKNWICPIDKAYVEDRKVILEYDLLSDTPKNRTINIGEIL